jgi:hypothetical protein
MSIRCSERSSLRSLALGQTEQSARLRRAVMPPSLDGGLSRPLYRPTATSMARFTREEVARWADVIMAAGSRHRPVEQILDGAFACRLCGDGLFPCRLPRASTRALA